MKILYVFSGPYVEIDMRSGEIDGYDAIFLSPHKFLGGPGSPSILLMRKVLHQLESSPPSTCGGGTVNYVNGFNEKVIEPLIWIMLLPCLLVLDPYLILIGMTQDPVMGLMIEYGLLLLSLVLVKSSPK